jgi:sulfopyruvate decarboxylase subunit beta
MVSNTRPSRAEYYQALAGTLPEDALVVTSLGNASYLWAATRDRPENFYLEDAMGLALPLALGLATARPDRQVIVVEGDGGLLMHMGTLVTVGATAPKNLTILLIQNGVHAASGGQALTNADLDIAVIARAMHLRHAETITSAEQFRTALPEALDRDGPTLLALATEPDLEPVTPPAMLDPVATKQRFMTAIKAPRYLSVFFGGGTLSG